jgi:hypothetical protein
MQNASQNRWFAHTQNKANNEDRRASIAYFLVKKYAFHESLPTIKYCVKVTETMNSLPVCSIYPCMVYFLCMPLLLSILLNFSTNTCTDIKWRTCKKMSRHGAASCLTKWRQTRHHLRQSNFWRYGHARCSVRWQSANRADEWRYIF